MPIAHRCPSADTSESTKKLSLMANRSASAWRLGVTCRWVAGVCAATDEDLCARDLDLNLDRLCEDLCTWTPALVSAVAALGASSVTHPSKPKRARLGSPLARLISPSTSS